jgi:succinyl-CoA synthetase alpha subunit
MSILADDKTRILIQGITGREAASMSREMLDYGARIVAGVTPGKAGQEVHGIPVYDTVMAACQEHAPDAAVVSVPPRMAKDAVMEDAAHGIKLGVVLTERIPRQDVVEMIAYAGAHGMMIIGPNSPGIICPGKTRLGYLGGSNPERAFQPGPVGLISRSGGMTTEIANLLCENGIGVTTAIGMGGDPVVGSTYLDLFPLFESDPETQAIVIYCEPGGGKEEALAEMLGKEFNKPLVAFLGGRFVDRMPGMRFGHASVIVRPESGSGSAEEKIRTLRNAGAMVVEHYSELPGAVRGALSKVG